MSRSRAKLSGVPAVHHLYSTTAGAQRCFGSLEQEKFSEFLGAAAAFAGVQIITVRLRSNHFHILARIQEGRREPLSTEDYLARLSALYPDPLGQFGVSRQDLTQDRPQDWPLKKRLVERMNDMSRFMQDFLQRFTVWFNTRHDRQGVLWASRFGSRLIEDTPALLHILDHHIQLNETPPGYPRDPKDGR